ncbi:MAG: Smr/MutS family endonuclease [Gammaproteobacteria bacterium]|nr:Smr/MutS family endonuclease [Gammaproteobacteria bacterium]
MKAVGQISDEDRALFRAEITDTTPIDPVNIRVSDRPNPSAIRRVSHPGRPRQLYYEPEIATLSSEDLVQFAREGIQRKTLRRLRRGQVEIDAQIDLHHLKLIQAGELLLEFLETCQAGRLRCALVVHGKGKRSNKPPAMKNAMQQWLPTLPQVLAYCSAQPRDGGSGALYLLIKSPRNQRN